MAREPGYCLHKPTGQAYVNLGGKVVYLGQHGTEESKRKYNQLKPEWLVNRHSPKYSPQPTGPTVADVGSWTNGRIDFVCFPLGLNQSNGLVSSAANNCQENKTTECNQDTEQERAYDQKCNPHNLFVIAVDPEGECEHYETRYQNSNENKQCKLLILRNIQPELLA